MRTGTGWIIGAAGAILAGSLAALALDRESEGPDAFAAIRAANAHLATPEAAEAAGYARVTGHVPRMGTHYMHSGLAQAPFDPARPPLLSYVPTPSGALRLGAVEYAKPRTTSVPPDGFPGDADVWGVHEANCHYADGTEFQAGAAEACPAEHPTTRVPFASWHPDLWTLHVWVFEENPEGAFSPLNPRVA